MQRNVFLSSLRRPQMRQTTCCVCPWPGFPAPGRFRMMLPPMLAPPAWRASVYWVWCSSLMTLPSPTEAVDCEDAAPGLAELGVPHSGQAFQCGLISEPHEPQVVVCGSSVAHSGQAFHVSFTSALQFGQLGTDASPHSKRAWRTLSPRGESFSSSSSGRCTHAPGRSRVCDEGGFEANEARQRGTSCSRGGGMSRRSARESSLSRVRWGRTHPSRPAVVK